MISEKDALEIHVILIERFGGSDGVRDRELLDSALTRAYQAFDGKELYPTPIDKAAAMLESIVKNHPFTDGNKRTGYVLARLLLMNEQLDINPEQEHKYQFIISISIGELVFDQIRDWLAKNSRYKRLYNMLGRPHLLIFGSMSPFASPDKLSLLRFFRLSPSVFDMIGVAENVVEWAKCLRFRFGTIKILTLEYIASLCLIIIRQSRR